ncbi:hypothetical protein [Variovorax sp. YR566]|uniref:hypothetical protein n=1 Tax=Variovorax sp. YR566 TaxID=3450237 RepID=UPI003F7F7829
MKKVICALLACAATSAFAFDYKLTFDQTCSYDSAKRTFPCKKSDQPVTELKEVRGKWFGVNPGGTNVIELEVLKDDQYITVLRNPVYFSGISLVHLMKKTGRFYWSETAYSDIRGADESTMMVGTFVLGFSR